MMNVHAHRSATRSRVGRTWIWILAIIFGVAIMKIISTHIKSQQLSSSTNNVNNENSCLLSFGSYGGNKYESTAPHALTTGGETIGNKCLIESRWMRVAQHQVRMIDDNKQPANNIIDDWLWIDYHDRINVLVQDPKSTADNPSFLILKQTKYALSSKQSLAVVGGIIEPGEEPLDAAKREVEEELQVSCNSWTHLGRYRTDVNRGMGWVNPFLARDCIFFKEEVGSDVAQNNEVGAHDMEKQNVQSLTLSEVKAAVMNQEFVEVQWSNTVALAMLHLM